MREIKKPAFMKEAEKTKSHSILGEMIIFIVLYVISIFVEAMALVPGLLVYGLIHPISAGIEQYNSLLQNRSQWVTVYMLFAEIFLIVLYTGYCKFIEKRPLSSMGFTKRNMSSFYAKGIGWSAVLISGAYLICVLTGACHFEGVSAQLVPGYVVFYLIGYMIQGLAEEVICRGYLLVSLSRRNSVWYSVILSSGVFMAMHMSNEHVTVLAYINLFLCGLLFGLLFVESGSIWMVAALHSGWNFLQGNIFGISVSGTAKASSVFDSSFSDGWSFMNGGDFGLEGGLAVSIVLAVGIYVVYRRMERRGMLVKRMQTESMNVVKETVSAEQTAQAVGNRPTQSSEEEGGFAQKTALNLDTLRNIEKQKEEAGVIVKEKPETVSYPSKTVFDADYFQK
ncbi:MAG: CPBP family intramembrane metalloprotease [Roseburia sp.]|nr:CPBP family intramembrane metalloprotease [Roseburia sp.]